MTSKTKKLYRYRSLNEFTFHSIESDYLWLSSPLQFNDPFDCQLFVEYFQLEKANIIKKESLNTLQEYYYGYYDNVIYKSFIDNGIACFSETKSEILMWSHYADFHRGICLEYEIDNSDENIFSLCRPVNYCLHYPMLNFSEFLKPDFNSTVDFIDKMVLTKSTSWKYEKEWRIVMPGYGNKKIDYPPTTLSGIYLGCNISDENKVRLISLIERKTIQPKVYQCEKNINSFSLDFTTIK